MLVYVFICLIFFLFPFSFPFFFSFSLFPFLYSFCNFIFFSFLFSPFIVSLCGLSSSGASERKEGGLHLSFVRVVEREARWDLGGVCSSLTGTTTNMNVCMESEHK